MTKLEKKRLELELVKVAAARFELEFRIEESLHQIERFKELIDIQKKREDELKKEIEVTNG